MKLSGIILSLMLVSTLFAEKSENRNIYGNLQLSCLKNTHIDIENDIIVFTCQYDDNQWIEIVPEGILYINGQRVYLNKYQRHLVRDYYDYFMDIIKQIKMIAKDGAIIGVKGVKIGLIAATGSLKMLLSDYDNEDLEDDIELEKFELEERAERLEQMSDVLDKTVEEFEALHDSMKEEIKELNELSWF